ncbi:SusC/RagA family TonB-linked outer membrane protein [Puteibacter caeruleilacunae]|nr:SusC/RagA family TonB-linked outer membrane protein [Puteibacter caeruleilacunae]
MKKIGDCTSVRRCIVKLCRIMKITLALIVALSLQTFASSYAQNKKFSFELKDVTTVDIIEFLEKESDYYFFFKNENQSLNKKMNVLFKDSSVQEVLDEVLKNSDLTYKVVDKFIAITAKQNASNQQVSVKTISGVVVDENGETLPGVSVIVKGTTVGVITDLDGKYSLDLPEGAEIVIFSFVGMKSQEVVLGNESVININMEVDAVGLEEVVAIGYGVEKKVNLTGSVSVVKSEALVKQSVFQTSQALQGISPGLTAIQSSGQPGSDAASLTIRGQGSFSASSSPLVLIDGVEGDINGVDANDIESISVLKDAGASAIYGSRASNGVILVTTKRAEIGKAKVEYSAYAGFQDPTNQPEFASAVEYLEATGDDALLQEYLNNPGDTDHYPDTDWVDLLFSEDGFMQYHNISVSGGTQAVRTKASISYQDQEGNIPTFDFKRYQGRFNTDFSIGNKLDISFDLNFRKSIQNSSPGGTRMSNAYRQPAIFPAIYSDGRYALPSTGGNPVAEVNMSGLNTTEGNYFRGVLKAVYKPIEGVTLTAMYSPEQSDSYNKNFRKQYEVYESYDSETPVMDSFGTNKQTQLSESNTRSFTDNFTATANYSGSFGQHDVGFLAGYEFIKYKWNQFGASRYDYIIQDFDILNNGNAENDSNYGSKTHNGLVSYFGRANYTYGGKYLFSVNIRRDGSSRFAEDSRWGWFPSFSAGWNIHAESFFPEDIFLNRFKLRASWGQLGNQSIGSDFPYASLIAIGSSHYANGTIQQGAAQQVLSNAEISWETGETTNIGVDFGMFDNRLSGTVEYYIRKTNDLLGAQKIPGTSGLDSPTANVYSMKNTGLDVNVEWRDKIGQIKYSVLGNIATLTNEVTDLNGVEFIKGSSSINQVGEAANSIYGYESIGLFANQEEIDNAPAQFGTLTPGDIRFKDQLTVDTNGDGIPDEADGVINEDDRVILGNSFPSLTFGLNLSAEFKGFDLAVALQGVGDRKVWLQRNLVQPLFNAGNISKWQLEESWTPENLDARYPVIKPYSGSSNNSRVNSTYVFDASYLRVRNITLGYTLPKATLARTPFSRLRVYVSGQNLLTFSKMPDGIDPLIPNGSQGNIYPIAVSYTMGVNVSF